MERIHIKISKNMFINKQIREIIPIIQTHTTYTITLARGRGWNSLTPTLKTTAMRWCKTQEQEGTWMEEER